MGKIDKKAAPAVQKKAKVKKTIEKPKPAQKSPAKKAIKAEKIGISGKFTGLKPKTSKKKPVAKDDNVNMNGYYLNKLLTTFSYRLSLKLMAKKRQRRQKSRKRPSQRRETERASLRSTACPMASMRIS